MKNYNIKGAFNFSEAVTSEISGRIGIINQSEIPSLTKAAFNGSIPPEMFSVSKKRWRGDFRKRDCVFGIKETTKSTFSRISNAVCLSGDLLCFYIEPEGHGVGVLDGNVIFAKSKLEITIYDILRGKSHSLLFTNYSLPQNSPKRFIALKIPDEDTDYNQNFFLENGMSGLMLMRIREITEFHSMSDWSDTFVYSQELLPRYNDSFVQIAIYPWNLPLREFDFSTTQQNVQISSLTKFIIDPVDEFDDEIDVFNSRSYFPNFRSLSGGSPVDLSDEEKIQVIRHNTIALISSQLPLLNASSPLAPVLGIGMAEANKNGTDNDCLTARQRAYESQNSFSKSAMAFSLTGIPPLINTSSGLNDFSKDNNQLSLLARNPLRILLSNQNPDETQLSFSLLGQKSSGVSAPLNVFNSEDSIVLNEEKDRLINVYVRALQANSIYTSSKSSDVSDSSKSSESSESSESTSDKSGSSITNSSFSSSVEGDSISVSFDSEIPADKIKTVSFSFSIGNFDFKSFIDNSGLLREYIFYANDWKFSLSKNDIIYGRVGIEDENGVVSYWYSEYNIPAEYGKLSISDFRTKTRIDGSGLIDFYYSLHAPTELESASVQASISLNNGGSWSDITLDVSGDVGTVLVGQNRHFSWNPLNSIPEYNGESLTAKLTILSTLGSPAIGRSTCGTFSVEKAKGAYVAKHIRGIKQGYYDGVDIKNPFIGVRVKDIIVDSSSSISSYSSLSSVSSISSSSESSISSSSNSSSSSSSNSSSSSSP